MTALKQAFEDAGILPASERIDRLVRDAIKRCGRVDLASQALEQALLAEDDPALIWEFFAPDREKRLRESLQTMQTKIRDERGLNATNTSPGHSSDAANASGHARLAGAGRLNLRLALASPLPESSLQRYRTLLGRPIGDCSFEDLTLLRRRAGTESVLATRLLALWPGHAQKVSDFLNDTEFDALRAAAEAEVMRNAE